jgi:two-component system, LytTR family, sensor kinase
MKKNFKYHILFWVLYFILNLIINYYQDKESFDLFNQFVKYFPSIGLFYFVFYLLKKYWINSKTAFIALFFISILIFYYLRFLIFYWLYFTIILKEKYTLEYYHFFLSGLWWWLHYTIYACFYYYFINTRNIKQKQYELERENIILEKENIALENQQLELEKEKIKAEYNYLKVQINPHFLYNTLGFFVDKTMAYNEEVANGLIKLSEIMRYSLKKENSNGMLPLQSEIENIENYIDLQKLRFGSKLQLSYTKTGNVTNQYILPHILITIVENAFKHGNPCSTIQPIVIALKIVEDTAFFNVVNEIDQTAIERSGSSVGIDNLQQRLQLVYVGRHLFQYKETTDTYSTNLIIPLH